MFDQVIEIPGEIGIVVTGVSCSGEGREESGDRKEAKAQGFHRGKISRLRASVEKYLPVASGDFTASAS